MKEKISEFGRKFFQRTSSFTRQVIDILTSLYFWLLVGCVFIGMYAFIMLLVAYILGVNPWITLILPLVPFVAVWHRILKKRVENYVASLMKPRAILNLEKALKDYVELLEKQKQKRR